MPDLILHDLWEFGFIDTDCVVIDWPACSAELSLNENVYSKSSQRGEYGCDLKALVSWNKYFIQQKWTESTCNTAEISVSGS